MNTLYRFLSFFMILLMIGLLFHYCYKPQTGIHMAEKTFSEKRASYEPFVSDILKKPFTVSLKPLRRAKIDEAVTSCFSPSFVARDQVYLLEKGSSNQRISRPLTIGVLFSGGPASGGHAVVAGLVDCITEINPESRCIGFLGGPKGLLRDEYRTISLEEARAVRYTGGFDLLGTGRDKISGEDALRAALKVVTKHQLDGLIVIGGDDSNTNAAILADYFVKNRCSTQVIGVPKTIDGDLAAPELPISFGFDTATRTYSETIGNLSKDALSSKKQYFFVRLMGRDASHITLECALQTHPNVALISEEVLEKSMSLQDVTVYVADLIDERLKAGKQYGLILLPEGLIEHLSDVRGLIHELNGLKAVGTKAFNVSSLTVASQACFQRFPSYLAQQLLLDRDSHGNVSVSKIETDKLLAMLVEEELHRRTECDKVKRPFAWNAVFCGYEGRCQYPTNFDVNYCTSLGRLASIAVTLQLNGYLMAIDKVTEDISHWRPCCIPLISMMGMEKRLGVMKPVITKVKVDLKGVPFQEFAKVRNGWRLHDDYQQPGPIQY